MMLITAVRLGKRLAICSLSAGILVLASGCARSHRHTVAVIPEITALETSEGEHAGVASAVLGTNWKIYWNAAGRKDDVARQIELVENAIALRDGGLILSPDHPLALNTLVSRAIARGIPTVIVGSHLSIPPNPKLAYILNDDEETGKLAADRAGTILNGRGNVALIGSEPAISATALRTAAFRHRLSENYSAIHILNDLPSSRTIEQGSVGAQQILERYPKLDAIIALDIIATRTSFSALKSQKNQGVRVIACDQELDLLYYLRKGQIDSVIVENTFEMGYRAMNLIKAGLRGESISGSQLLAPVLVTRENVDQPDVQRMLSMDWRPTR
jgi:ribose transport system substrate-binding protein